MIIGIVMVVIVYTLLNVYLAWRYTPFIRSVIPSVKFWWVAVVFAVLGCSYVLPSCLPMWGWVRTAGVLGCYWMGFFAYSMLFFVILEIVRRVVIHRLSEANAETGVKSRQKYREMNRCWFWTIGPGMPMSMKMWIWL